MDARYNLDDLEDFTFDSVMLVTANDANCLLWCMSVGLLKSSMICPHCTKDMKLSAATHRRRATCGSIERSVKSGSFLPKSNLPVRTIVRIMQHWASRRPVADVIEDLRVASATATNWYKFCRNKKSKCNCGTCHPECWLFGGVDQATKKWFGVLTYEDRTKPFGSYVSTNESHTLVSNPALTGMDYSHQLVNDSEDFVNPANGAHTQGIESVWEMTSSFGGRSFPPWSVW
ncbi:hypothetical protein H257_11655 [Aphanomyces astaci]|uniref:Uncharacterized protein n=1 Tax=Aphanomyces astaci TaxID=112090 RepID=W4G1F8_APHAT|nr:hypothetical protein H257_11655 [Aphanomyces astaci]ETV73530.1 hypothetical protein H257_11655 [Aphanomyces astaci]|eukprot:XP_009836956.1 hypothetical protein H257_11655 [Aphanomyces astaci]